MNANAVAKHYCRLTPEERFRLILAAGARGDEAERDRLVNAGGRITLSIQDHAPYAHAFNELALLVYIELLGEAARYDDAFHRADYARDIFGDASDEEEEGDETEGDNAGDEPEAGAEAEPDAKARAVPGESDLDEQSIGERYFRLALAAGFVLRTKANGWKLFCERLSIPPLALWECLPGFDRLQRALSLSEKAAFYPEGFLRWMNDARPEGKPEITEVPFTVEGMADATEELFHQRVEWWGG